MRTLSLAARRESPVARGVPREGQGAEVMTRAGGEAQRAEEPFERNEKLLPVVAASNLVPHPGKGPRAGRSEVEAASMVQRVTPYRPGCQQAPGVCSRSSGLVTSVLSTVASEAVEECRRRRRCQRAYHVCVPSERERVL
ncbi:hypothetical protein MTO96_052231 [Rhipicephalus appendiculatus]